MVPSTQEEIAYPPKKAPSSVEDHRLLLHLQSSQGQPRRALEVENVDEDRPRDRLRVQLLLLGR